MSARQTASRAATTVLDLFDNLSSGGLEVTTPDGRSHRFGDARIEAARIEIHDWSFFPRLLAGGSTGVGESYMDGQWSSPDLVALVGLVIANRDALRHVGARTLFRIVVDRVIHALRTNRRSGARRNIQAHYDLSNELYGAFLDDTMTYSSAVFVHEGQDLADAQRNKLARIAAKARLEPGCRVLEIGCGWGSFALHAARDHDCHVTALTLADEQARYVRALVEREGLTGRVEVRTVDYRDIEGTFDRIVSIEMLEAVGHRYLGAYAASVDRLLEPDGLVALQVITIPEQRYASYRRRPDFIQRHIFPGGHLPSLEALVRAFGRNSTLYVDDVENIAMHYAETLRRWRLRFLDARQRVEALGFDERFQRMWEFYLAYCEAAFRARYIADLQIVLTRPLNPTLARHPYQGDANRGGARPTGGGAGSAGQGRV